MLPTREQIEERIVDFFADLFDELFTTPLTTEIDSRLRRSRVQRAIGDASDAASQTIIRLLLNERISAAGLDAILSALDGSGARLPLHVVSNANIAPDTIAAGLLDHHPPPLGADDRLATLYRVTLQSIVQVVTLVGPVLAEWRKVGFAETFEVLGRVVDRLNRMSAQLDILSQSGQEAVDERYELTYRDYLMQRFHRVEAGTVKMTTNLNVDLRELFVMPEVRPRTEKRGEQSPSADAMLDLSAARKRFNREPIMGLPDDKPKTAESSATALDVALPAPRLVLIGTPGSGKSTFLEWLQIQIAMGDTELVLAGKQAIPLLLRIRQLDPDRLPSGTALIAAATASADKAALAPPGWMDRMLERGRVLVMIDGLDEVDPQRLQQQVLPWLGDLVQRFRRCRFIVSSRPSGYNAGTFKRLGFLEADLLDFDTEAISAYTCHWCVAVRLARNETEAEARREGKADGERIVAGFRAHPYINDLARSPLMLSAICLVNWFEGGQLPRDRAMLYRLCVEGLLHHWDQRRGIQSVYPLDEKLRVCRELAIAMQADDRAEYEAAKVQQVFAQVLADAQRADALLEHIRYRTGLLIERRPEVFAFAHLTFQEYLAAQAIHEGNRRGVSILHFVEHHDDPRWREVIPLFAGAGTATAARELLRALMTATDKGHRGAVLGDAYLAAERQLATDAPLREDVIKVIAGSQGSGPSALDGFSETEVAPVANAWLAKRVAPQVRSVQVGQSFRWLERHPQHINRQRLEQRLRDWMEEEDKALLDELAYLGHFALDAVTLHDLLPANGLYQLPAPEPNPDNCSCLGEIALLGLAQSMLTTVRDDAIPVAAMAVALEAILQTGSHKRRGLLWHYVAALLNTVARAANRQSGVHKDVRFPAPREMDKQKLGPEQLRLIIQGLDEIVASLGPVLSLTSEDMDEEQQP